MPGVYGILTVAFLLAKVFEIAPVAGWSWWLVLMPFYAPAILLVMFFLIGAAYAVLRASIDRRRAQARYARFERLRSGQRR